MSVKYNVVERGKPGDPTAPKKYYPSAIARGRVDLRHIAERAAAVSTVSVPDSVAVIEAFFSIIPDELGRGNVVEIGDLGSFWLKFKSEASATPEEVTSKKITAVLARFIPAKKFKEKLKYLSFEKNKAEQG